MNRKKKSRSRLAYEHFAQTHHTSREELAWLLSNKLLVWKSNGHRLRVAPGFTLGEVRAAYAAFQRTEPARLYTGTDYTFGGAAFRSGGLLNKPFTAGVITDAKRVLSEVLAIKIEEP